ncbi:arsenate reductase [Sphingomonas sp. PsM26]|nr:arsenate reductase [Sphingomonas sp. PsM26]
MPATLYGIPACDTVKKARTWLDTNGVPYTFHNYKTSGVDPALLREWIDQLGWETVLNRAGTTFRKLPEADKTDLNADKALAILLANPSAIKRPILVIDDVLLAGFKPDTYVEALKP